MMPLFKDQSPALVREFYYRLDPKARAMFLEIDDYVFHKYGARLTITCIERTEGENAKVGGVKKSAHIKEDGRYVRAIDIRTRDLSSQIIADAVAYGARVWGPMIHILRHGPVDHIHMNVNYGYATAFPS